MATEPRPASQEANPGYCNWHPETETRLYCSHCGKSICTLCLVQAPVGIRCRECGRPEKLPTYDVQPGYYARAIGVGIAIAIGGGVLWYFLDVLLLRGIPFVSGFIGLGIAYGASELISRSVNMKRGTGLAWIAGCSVGGACLIFILASPTISVWDILLGCLAVYVAVSRIR